jgi:hypothetical protein
MRDHEIRVIDDSVTRYDCAPRKVAILRLSERRVESAKLPEWRSLEAAIPAIQVVNFVTPASNARQVGLMAIFKRQRA